MSTGPTDPASGRSSYLLDNRAPETGRRFSHLSLLWDPWTIQHLERVGVRSGWKCLEVGAGGGSVARWLSERVGAEGHVLATDLDPRHLGELRGPNVEVRQHDLSKEDIPIGGFDLVHTRLVLQHVPRPNRALHRMVAAVRPGGWLVLEDFAGSLPFGPSRDRDRSQLAVRAHALETLIRRRGGNPHYGRKLVPRLMAEGLRPVHAEGFVSLWHGGDPGADLFLASMEQVRDEALEQGLMTTAEFDELCTLLKDPGYATYSPLLITAWAQKPA